MSKVSLKVHTSKKLDNAALHRDGLFDICDMWVHIKFENIVDEVLEAFEDGMLLTETVLKKKKPIFRVFDGADDDPAYMYFVGTEAEILKKIKALPLDDED